MNNMIFSKKDTLPLEVEKKAICDGREWQENQESKSKPLMLLVSKSVEAPCGEYVCQKDAVWQEDCQLAGLGWTLVHQRLKTMQCFFKGLEFVRLPFNGRGLAIRAALTHVLGEEIRTISVKSDSLQLVRAINSGSKVSKLHGIFTDMSFLFKRFESISFSYIRRNHGFSLMIGL
ncbi:unnamed protein product [Arabis nemorensis]|uniref:RNase H type-1 domain-containing protein n=1 Tax=Arabis nemorensis TaxID=586526 RepID=A0A565ATZ3_9BRAS|nr:unnamed protein product [Arabis nemorensis]